MGCPPIRLRFQSVICAHRLKVVVRGFPAWTRRSPCVIQCSNQQLTYSNIDVVDDDHHHRRRRRRRRRR